MTATEQAPTSARGKSVTLKALHATCLDREEQFYDDIVSLKSMSMDPEHPGKLIIQRGKAAPRVSHDMMDHVWQQASGVLYGLPGGYLKKLVEGDHSDPELAARNFNHWVTANKDREVLLRFHSHAKDDGATLRAMLPASWNPIPYAEVVQTMMARHGPDQKVSLEAFDDKVLAFNIVTGKLDGVKKKVGDDVEWGMRFKDSDVGFGTLQMMPYTLTLVCTNGMTTTADGAHVLVSHSGKQAADTNAVIASIAQGMEMITGYSRHIVDQMQAAQGITLVEDDMDAVFKRINKAHDVTKLEDRYVREGWVLESERRPEPTVLKLANAYTRAANGEEIKDDSRFKLQAVGGAVLRQATSDYRW